MKYPQTIDEIRQAVGEAFPGSDVDVIDLSHQHKGHLEADSGHYEVRIKNSGTGGLTMIQKHRIVYEAVNMHQNTKIHALKIRFDVL
ncbi:MAG: BolA/IbaG family iron-sulfur metabolism protein [Candidatus Omnitrophica bacterium]|nr:BolA/IbaG family iron-sulfur metabolism protein [Candidatus Omnitrophota bacterium]